LDSTGGRAVRKFLRKILVWLYPTPDSDLSLRRASFEKVSPACQANSLQPRIADLSSIKAVNFSSPRTTNVYLLQSEQHPQQQYVGQTRDLRQRLKEHNEGRSPHAAKFYPWILVTHFAFAREKTAIAFEKYLKSGSGRAFIKRHFF
jgi:predicted GIY-YIG superfamily endonuclease